MVKERTVDDIPEQGRRFDSVSWLINGRDEVCGAVAFDGEKILWATNKTTRTPLIDTTQKYLQYVARESIGFENSLHQRISGAPVDADIAVLKSQEDAEISRFIESIYGSNQYKSMNKLAPKSTGRGAWEIKRAFNDSLAKITDSIISGCLTPGSTKSLPREIIDAMAKDKFKFVKGENGPKGEVEHAEVKIVGELLKNVGQDNVFYIGVAFRCCENCERVVKAVNNVYSRRLNRKNPPFDVREIDEGSNIKFNRVAHPEFLRASSRIIDETIKNEINEEIRKLENDPKKRERDKLHTRSSSPLRDPGEIVETISDITQKEMETQQMKKRDKQVAEHISEKIKRNEEKEIQEKKMKAQQAAKEISQKREVVNEPETEKKRKREEQSDEERKKRKLEEVAKEIPPETIAALQAGLSQATNTDNSNIPRITKDSTITR